jgi:hypothetical protein
MDIEKLNKSQIVLLTLLVSFMTSIATGIVTVSLMEQAPPAITETVNRVVERTVERVVSGQSAAAASPVVKTVVVKESELIPKALEAVSPSVVRLYAGTATSSVFLGLGAVISDSGTIAADASSLVSLGDTRDVTIELSGSMRVPGVIGATDAASGITYVTGATSTKDGRVQWFSAQLAQSPAVLGQTIILIAGKSAARVAQGLVTGVVEDESGKNGGILVTDLPKDVIIQGSPIVDMSGSLIGISTKISRQSDEAGFIPAIRISPHTAIKNSQTQ